MSTFNQAKALPGEAALMPNLTLPKPLQTPSAALTALKELHQGPFSSLEMV